MKRLFALLAMVPLLAFGQWRVQPYNVNIETDNFQNIELDDTSLYRTNLLSRYRYSLQHLADWVDDNWQPPLQTNWTVLLPTQATAQATFNCLDGLLAGWGATNGLMRGTNIYSFTFNPTNKTWYPPADLVGVENLSFLSDTSLAADDPWGVEIATNGYWDTNELAWTTNALGTNTVAFISHPPFIVGDDVQFPSFVTKEEFYAILNSMGFANFDWFTYDADHPSVYGSAASPPTNNAVFAATNTASWAVPDSLSEGQVIRVHLWGGGGYDNVAKGAPGGYAYGDFVVVDPTNYVSANPYMVTTNSVLAVHVGPASGRAAIWRISDTNFATYTNELLVAGGGGGGGYSYDNATYLGYGGPGGGLLGLPGADGAYRSISDSIADAGLGGTTNSGGSGGSSPATTAGAAGTRVWGGATVTKGGDGFYGGGGGASRNSGSLSFLTYGGAGGGSGYVAPGWDGIVYSNAVVTNTLSAFATNAVAGAVLPPATTEAAYGLYAGAPNNPGRVAFEIQFDSWSTNSP